MSPLFLDGKPNMSTTAILAAMGWLLVSGVPRGSGVAFAQTTPAQQTAQPAATTTPAAPAPPPAAAKPCPAALSSQSAPQPDCKPASQTRKPKSSPPAAPGSGPTKKVVHNGSTSDPAVDISPRVNEQQASQQRESTNRLLAKTDENLKIVKSRQPNPGQQDTVKQIRSYMKQSKDATASGDVQRAYTLANKARMLSGDLVKH
jgi:hypothetical protein